MLRSLLVAALLVTASATQAGAGDRLNATLLDRPLALPDFALADQNGAPFTLQRLKSHWSLLAVGYTSCPDVCPFTLANLNAVLETAAKQESPAMAPMVVFVAVDPARDKPVLKQWIEQFNPHFIGITGAPAQIEKLVTSVGAVYRIGKPDASGWYSVAHSAAVQVIDPEGRVRARLLPPMPPNKTAAFLARLMSSESTAEADVAK
jgi:protein SCO1/2